MSITAHCHWGMAEDVTIVTKDSPAILMESLSTVHGCYTCDSIQIPMTREEARQLAAQLIEAADRCDYLEDNIPE